MFSDTIEDRVDLPTCLAPCKTVTGVSARVSMRVDSIFLET
jgi:hypothetical protein